MQILYAISVANFLLLLWVAFALSRHVRHSRAELVLAAAKPGVPGPLQLRPEVDRDAEGMRKPVLPERRTQPERRQSYDSLYAQYMAEHQNGMTGTNGPTGIAPNFAQSRKIREATMGRLDPAYFSKDAGDLTDPDSPPRLRANSSSPSTQLSPSHPPNSPRAPRRYS